MSLFGFLALSNNAPFSIALLLMVCIAAMEGVTTLLGMGLSSVLENLLPEFDLGLDLDVDLDVDGEVQAPMALSRFLGWLHVGQMPVLILFVLFLTAFGLTGLGIQTLVGEMFGRLLPAGVAVVPTLIVSLPVVRVLGNGLKRILPRDETSAVRSASFIGRVAVITMGVARQGSPAEARLKDRYGQTHYLMIEPDSAEESFKKGDQVLLVEKVGAHFRGILNTKDVLVS